MVYDFNDWLLTILAPDCIPTIPITRIGHISEHPPLKPPTVEFPHHLVWGRRFVPTWNAPSFSSRLVCEFFFVSRANATLSGTNAIFSIHHPILFKPWPRLNQHWLQTSLSLVKDPKLEKWKNAVIPVFQSKSRFMIFQLSIVSDNCIWLI